MKNILLLLIFLIHTTANGNPIKVTYDHQDIGSRNIDGFIIENIIFYLDAKMVANNPSGSSSSLTYTNISGVLSMKYDCDKYAYNGKIYNLHEVDKVVRPYDGTYFYNEAFTLEVVVDFTTIFGTHYGTLNYSKVASLNYNGLDYDRIDDLKIDFASINRDLENNDIENNIRKYIELTTGKSSNGRSNNTDNTLKREQELMKAKFKTAEILAEKEVERQIELNRLKSEEPEKYYAQQMTLAFNDLVSALETNRKDRVEKIKLAEQVRMMELENEWERNEQNYQNQKKKNIIKSAEEFSEGLSKVRYVEYGYINANNEVIIPLKYSEANAFSQGLAAVCLGESPDCKCGFINKKGETIIPFKYSYTQSFNEEIAIIGNGFFPERKYGLIDKAGTEISPIKYDWIYDFIDGYAKVRLGGKNGYINQKGEEVIPLLFDHLSSYQEGQELIKTREEKGEALFDQSIYDHELFFNDFNLAWAKKNNKWGMVNKKGETVTQFLFDNIELYDTKFAYVETSSKIGYVDPKGKIISLGEYKRGGKFSNGMALVQVGDRETGKCGYININGELVVPAIYDLYGGSFKEGLACVSVNKMYGFVDKKGNVTIPLKYEKAYEFGDGRAAVKKDEKFGFINSDGLLVIPYIYDDVYYGFSEGLAAVSIHEKWGFINRNGVCIIPFRYDEPAEFYDGIASVELNGKEMKINQKGQCIEGCE